MAASVLRAVCKLMRLVDFAPVPRRHRHKKKWVPSHPEQCHSNDPYPPTPCGKGFSPVLTLELPVAPGKDYSYHPDHTVNPAPKTGKKCNDLPPPRDPSSCLTGASSSVPRRFPSPTPPSPSSAPQSSFEPSLPTLLGRPCCLGPRFSGSSPTSPCFGRLGFLGSPSLRPQSLCSTWVSTPTMQCSSTPSSLFDQHTYLCYCCPVPSTSLAQPPGTSPVTSPQLIHIPLETGPIISLPLTPESEGTCPMISPPLTHRPLRTGIVVSPPLSHLSMETRRVVSTTLSGGVLETGTVISPPLSHWSSGRSYKDPPAPPPSPTASCQPDSLCHDNYKLSDPHEPKPQLDVPLDQNCGPSLSFQEGISGSSSSPQKGSFHYCHISSEAHLSTPGSPYCAIHLPSESTVSSCLPQFQAPKKPCFESLLSWGTGGNSYVLLNPGTMIPGTPCPPELPLSPCPYPDLYFHSPLANQSVAPAQTVPCRSYNEPSLPTPVCPHMKSPKSLELGQSRTPHKCRSLVNTAQCTSDHPKPPQASTSPLLPTQPCGLSGPSCVEPSLTTPSNCCTKEPLPGTPLPTVIPGILKTVFPTSFPLCIPHDPILPNSYAKIGPHGASVVSSCNTHMYSVVPPTPGPCVLSSSLSHSVRPLQCHNHPVVPPCTYGTPRGQPPLPSKPVKPPCSTHIYSFIPLRTPFDPQCLPIIPQSWPCPDNIPCGFHTYSVASQSPGKEPAQTPYSCPLLLPKSSSSSSSNPSCTSTTVSEHQSIDSQSKSSDRSRSQSRSQSKSPRQVIIKDPSKRTSDDRSQKRNKSPHDGKSKSRSKSKSPHRGRSQKRSKSPQNKKF